MTEHITIPISCKTARFLFLCPCFIFIGLLLGVLGIAANLIYTYEPILGIFIACVVLMVYVFVFAFILELNDVKVDCKRDSG